MIFHHQIAKQMHRERTTRKVDYADFHSRGRTDSMANNAIDEMLGEVHNMQDGLHTGSQDNITTQRNSAPEFGRSGNF